MYSVPQLQALDFLLKRLLHQGDYSFSKKKLKFVISLDQKYWTGDFLTLDKIAVVQEFITDFHSVVIDKYYAVGNNCIPLLANIWKQYTDVSKSHAYREDPFASIDELPLLFDTLLKLLERADIKPDQSPFFPYLLNARALDGSLELPFLHIGDRKVDLVSLIEVG